LRPFDISALAKCSMLMPIALAAAPLQASDAPSVASTIFIERNTGAGGSLVDRLGPGARLLRGDRVVTVLRWDRAAAAGYRLTSAVPAGLLLQSASRDGLEVSSDGGSSWQKLPDGDAIPAGITHLRWPLGRAPGTLSYRAIVR
jgi:hypothetical protein